MGRSASGFQFGVGFTPETNDLSRDFADDIVVEGNLEKVRISEDRKQTALTGFIDTALAAVCPNINSIQDGARARAYNRLTGAKQIAPLIAEPEVETALGRHTFVAIYHGRSAAMSAVARAASRSILGCGGLGQVFDPCLHAFIPALISFRVTIGWVIRFGVMSVMGVINMGHGEFIMMRAYAGCVFQKGVPDHAIPIVLAKAAAFAIAFVAGVTMERLVIRWLYSRALATLLDTFGIAFALQQLAGNLPGIQAGRRMAHPRCKWQVIPYGEDLGVLPRLILAWKGIGVVPQSLPLDAHAYHPDSPCNAPYFSIQQDNP